MTGSSIIALFATMFAVAIVPGPSDFAVVARSITSGFGHAVMMIAGILAADFLFILLALYGLAILAGTMGAFFVLVKYLCGLFLIWLGIGAWRVGLSDPNCKAIPKYSGFSSFSAGFLITLGDPKAILFYMGLFPAFMDLSNVSIMDTVIVMLIATVIICAVKLSYAYMAAGAGRLFASTRVVKGLNMSAGSILAGIGVFLLLPG
jgi:threonine/homoserine/homoserine lactone efflux protein